MLLRLIKFTILLFFIFLSNNANAEIVNASAVSEYDSLKPHYSYKARIIFNLQIENGWHIYWKNSGETGEPTIVEINSFPKESIKKTYFSLPSRFNKLGFTEFGFEKESYIMVEYDISAPNRIKNLPLDFEIKWLACNGNCVPGSTKISFKIPVNGKENIKNKDFDDYMKYFPLKTTLNGKFYTENDDLSIFIPNKNNNVFNNIKNIEIFPYTENILLENNYKLEKNDKGIIIKTKTLETSGIKKIINALLKIDNEKGINIKLKKSKTPFKDNSTPFKNIFLMGLTALVGGIILNFMPCIFPILSLKAFQIIQNKKNKKENIKEALFYTLGILTSFLSLGTIISFINSKETNIGWGFQMQNSVFVLVMIYLFVLIGFMFSDILKVNFNFINQSPKSSYLTGVLAVLIASPCTAPFMGTAIAFAIISKSTLSIILIFSMLGFGFALPWILVALYPKTSLIIPKPGKWMEDFKHILSFLIYGTVIWFLWIFMEEVNNHIISIFIIASIIFICFTCLIFSFKNKILKFIVLTLCLSFIAFCFKISIPQQNIKQQNNNISFSFDEIESFKLEGTPYFIKFSAKWCLSCLFNEKTIFSKPEIINLFKDNDITIIDADWTNKDKEIAKAIQNYKGLGVPLYVYFNGEKEIVINHKITKKYIKELINKE